MRDQFSSVLNYESATVTLPVPCYAAVCLNATTVATPFLSAYSSFQLLSPIVYRVLAFAAILALVSETFLNLLPIDLGLHMIFFFLFKSLWKDFTIIFLRQIVPPGLDTSVQLITCLSFKHYVFSL